MMTLNTVYVDTNREIGREGRYMEIEYVGHTIYVNPHKDIVVSTHAI